MSELRNGLPYLPDPITGPLNLIGNFSATGGILSTSTSGLAARVSAGLNTGMALQSGSTEYSLYLNASDNSYRLYSSLGGDRFVITNTGNVLFGGTIDGGQKLQVAGTVAATTGAPINAFIARYNSANSLFGITLNSSGQAVLSENCDANTYVDSYSKTGLPAFRLGNVAGSGTVPFWIDVAASGTAGNAITWTNAFKIDASLNATFAGRAAINGSYATVATGNYTLSLGNFSAGTRVNAGLRTDSIGDLDVSAGSAGSLSLNYDTSVPVLCFGNFSISSGKTFKLGNAYTAAVVAPTGYVTIQDSTGTTYKVCVLL